MFLLFGMHPHTFSYVLVAIVWIFTLQKNESHWVSVGSLFRDPSHRHFQKPFALFWRKHDFYDSCLPKTLFGVPKIIFEGQKWVSHFFEINSPRLAEMTKNDQNIGSKIGKLVKSHPWWLFWKGKPIFFTCLCFICMFLLFGMHPHTFSYVLVAIVWIFTLQKKWVSLGLSWVSI